MKRILRYDEAALKLFVASHETDYVLMKSTMLYNGVRKMREVAP